MDVVKWLHVGRWLLRLDCYWLWRQFGLGFKVELFGDEPDPVLIATASIWLGFLRVCVDIVPVEGVA